MSFPPRNLVGLTFGKWKPVSYAGDGRWNCVCSGCGRQLKVFTFNLNNWTSKGCAQCRLKDPSRRTHGLSSQPGRSVPTYDSWRCMIGRCYNPNDTSYPKYGGAGIIVCERWLKFENFFADMGYRPDGMTLGRIENSKNYYPDNCRWETPTQQTRNRSNARVVIFNGQSVPLVVAAEKMGKKPNTLWLFLKQTNWPDIDLGKLPNGPLLRNLVPQRP